MADTALGCAVCESPWHETKEHALDEAATKAVFADPNVIEQSASEVQVGVFCGIPVMALAADEPDLILHATEKAWEKPILLQANSLIHGERAATHGPVKETFEKIAIIAKGMGVEISPQGICKVLIALKLARECYNPGHRDNLIDAAGYIGLLDELKS